MPKPDLKGCLSLASTASAVSALAAGAVGAWATIRFGPALAMGLAIYGGDTEPSAPEAPYPWTLVALGLAVFAAGAVVERRQPERLWAAHALQHGGAVLTALVPLVHLVHLWGRT